MVIQFGVKEHIKMAETYQWAEEELVKYLKIQNELIDDSKRYWNGETADAFRRDYEYMLQEGEYAAFMKYVRGMKEVMEESIPRFRLLQQMVVELPTAYGLPCDEEAPEILRLDEDAVAKYHELSDEIIAKNRHFCDEMTRIMDGCEGLVDFSEEKRELEELREEMHRMEVFKSKLDEYADEMRRMDNWMVERLSEFVKIGDAGNTPEKGMVFTEYQPERPSVSPVMDIANQSSAITEATDIDAGEGDLTGQGEEIEESTIREDAILNGREILFRRMERDENVDPNEIDWICTYIQLCQPSMLKNLYITDCYSSGDADRIYNVILDYYNMRPDTPFYRTTENRISQISDFMPSYSYEIQRFLDAFEQNREIYVTISERTNVPIEIIAIIHYRENTTDYLNGNFKIDITNGTDHPDYTDNQFIEQAENVFNRKYFQRFLNKYSLYPGTNDVIGMLCYMEVYNGLGYYESGILSPYIYSGTPLYESGKYTEDHVYEQDTEDQQMGAYYLLLALRGNINYKE